MRLYIEAFVGAVGEVEASWIEASVVEAPEVVKASVGAVSEVWPLTYLLIYHFFRQFHQVLQLGFGQLCLLP